MYPTFYRCHQNKFDRIGCSVAEISTFEEIASKPRPLMNINEMGTKNNRDLYSSWAIYRPSMKMTGPSVVDLECPQAGVTHTHSLTHTLTHTSMTA